MNEISAAVCVALLIPCAAEDVRTQRIHIRWLTAALVFSGIFAVWRFLQGQESGSELFLSTMPGIFLLLTAFLFPGRIGKGDGVVFLIIGVLIGAWNAFAVMLIALILSAACGGLLLLRGRADRNTTMPWVPFVLAGMLLWIGFSIWTGGISL